MINLKPYQLRITFNNSSRYDIINLNGNTIIAELTEDMALAISTCLNSAFMEGYLSRVLEEEEKEKRITVSIDCDCNTKYKCSSGLEME